VKPESQRIAIAEACGWTEIERINSGEFGGLRGVKPNGERSIVPSYCRDLNAMHEAHHTLDPDQQTDFARWLRSAVLKSPVGISHPGQLINATAAERAEAFLKTLNLWKP
jgi:hypothetical protein